MDLKDTQSKDVQAIKNVLKEMGIDDYEPRVINQLLEFSYRYVTTILDEARAFSTHAGKRTIDSDDIKVAIKSKVDYSFTTAPPRELLIDISKSKNKNPLPQVKYQSSIKLPPDRFCLHAPNYTLKTPRVSLSSQAKSSSSLFSNKSFTQQQHPLQASNNQTMDQSLTSNTSFHQNVQIKRRRDDEDDYDA